MEVLKKALWANWIQNLETGEGPWQSLLLNKYVKGSCIYGIKHKLVTLNQSRILSVKSILYKHGTNVGNGATHCFGKAGGLMSNLMFHTIDYTMYALPKYYCG